MLCWPAPSPAGPKKTLPLGTAAGRPWMPPTPERLAPPPSLQSGGPRGGPAQDLHHEQKRSSSLPLPSWLPRPSRPTHLQGLSRLPGVVNPHFAIFADCGQALSIGAPGQGEDLEGMQAPGRSAGLQAGGPGLEGPSSRLPAGVPRGGQRRHLLPGPSSGKARPPSPGALRGCGVATPASLPGLHAHAAAALASERTRPRRGRSGRRRRRPGCWRPGGGT